jgi:hypothetical protein
MEIEKEQERVETAKAGRSYSRDGEDPKPWPLEALAQPPSLEAQGFYPASKLSVKTWHSSTAPLAFPSYCLISGNHLNTSWSMKTYRRLKNVMVIMEWIPAQSALALTAEERPLSENLQQKLAKTFKMLDSDGSGVCPLAYTIAY